MSGHVNFDLQMLYLSVGVIEWPAHKVLNTVSAYEGNLIYKTWNGNR